MSKYDIRPQCEWQKRILNVKIRYSSSVRMAKKDFECQNTIFVLSANGKKGFRTSKYDIRPQCEWQKRIWNVKIRYSSSVRMAKKDLECQNTTFVLSANGKTGF